MKARNLTQSHARYDPTNFWIQCFSFRNFENEFQRSRGDFFLFFQPILDFKHSSDMEMSLKEVEIKRLQDCSVQTIQFAQKP